MGLPCMPPTDWVVDWGSFWGGSPSPRQVVSGYHDQLRHQIPQEAAEVRESTTKALLRSWPGGDLEEFWSVDGGLSGLDALQALHARQVPQRCCTVEVR